ncbi:helix-turn-helix domain-containing protein [Thiolinea disciformis]|uniref:helix-turn-helix domain-containing protein n=1 Tax=Thiolinea disciformis TaxID=125614 RepID=UPI000A03B176|nr:helix-turn-helix transcriptional regulator [Thiolinea disciformis]
MSVLDFAEYVNQRMERMNLSVASAAARSGVSRQTWHKLKRADIKEAKVSTIIKVAHTLETTPPELLNMYFFSDSQRPFK